MTQNQPESKPNQTRVSSVDIVKGIAILLMVFGHTEQGAMHRHWWNSNPGLVRGITFADTFVYSFHMPAFFFISGLFLAGSVARRGKSGFAIEKISTLLYPYVLWGLIGGLSGPLTERFRAIIIPFSWHGLFESLLTGGGSWFLISLFICQMLALLILRLPHWAQMCVAMLGCLFIPPSEIIIFYKPFEFLPFVVAGMWVGAGRLFVLENLRRIYAWIGFSILLAMQLVLMDLLGKTTRWSIIPMGLLGSLMLLLLSRGLRGTFADGILRWYGEASLCIFLIAPFAQGFGRELVLRILHTTAPVPQLVVPVVLAATIPAIIWHFQEMFHISWLFRIPSPRRKRLEPAPASAAR